ncbi:hypothetical protein THAOC_12287 [Thalassiosira oceanica]|uniref:Uncharacterized protein n=1 Tax=Thalassiosira oceanica TaxID=159749 RepID=K0T0G6_THAOC|nr:hypothetical protein THAOC_12287 [Thalassiosira oceanica]|eukprot:EJK66761.1 hypothetical protein THAOC_12287 [Thalassiosira oceanica]
MGGGGEGDDENASRRDDERVASALTNASIKSARSKKSLPSSKSESKKKRGVVGLTLVLGVAVGVFGGLYYENRKTAKAEGKAEAAYLAEYDGPWYYDEECLSPHERARNLKGDVKTSSVTDFIDRKRDGKGEDNSGTSDGRREHTIITSVPKPKADVHPKHYRKVRYLDLRTDIIYLHRLDSQYHFFLWRRNSTSVPREIQSTAQGLKAGRFRKVISSEQCTSLGITLHLITRTSFLYRCYPSGGTEFAVGPEKRQFDTTKSKTKAEKGNAITSQSKAVKRQQKIPEVKQEKDTKKSPTVSMTAGRADYDLAGIHDAGEA